MERRERAVEGVSLDAQKRRIDWLEDFLQDLEEDICARDTAFRKRKEEAEARSRRVLAQTKAELEQIAETEAALDKE